MSVNLSNFFSETEYGLVNGFEPSEYQKNIFDFIKNGYGNAVIKACAGSAKCLKIGTQVLLYNGDIIPVENVKTGDLLMGMDSTPRKVLSTTNGIGELFKIVPTKGDSFVCNNIHVLTLVNSISNEIFDIPLNEFLKNKGTRKNKDAKLFKIGVNFKEQKISLDPYLFGLWLGDGTKNEAHITNPDIEIIEYCKDYALKNNIECKINKRKNANCFLIKFKKNINSIHNENPLRRELIKTLINDEKRIPKNYLINSEKNRLELLAGIIDTDGYYDKGYYEITCKHKGLADDICYLARSLGFAVYCKEKITKISSRNFVGKCFKINILGHVNRIPCKVERKKAHIRKQKKDVLRNGFKVEPVGEGEYFGFELDGDGRFLLGDFTVTHNTTTIVKAVEFVPKNKKIGFIAFNTHIADEIKSKVPKHVDVRTLHSLGLLTIKSNKGNVPLEKNKLNNIYDTITNDFELSPKENNAFCKVIKSTVSQLKNNNLQPSKENIDKLMDYYSTELPDFVSEFGILTKNDFYKTTKKLFMKSVMDFSCVDYDDMIYMPVFHKMKCQIYDFMFVDECQDFSSSNAILALQAIKPTGRIVAVGDSNQSAYAFRGADIESIPKMIESLNATVLPLSISYRCPKSHIRKAKELVPEIEAAPNAIEGEIISIQDSELIEFIKKGDLAICRTNAPLIAPCLRLISKGIKANIRGRDFGTVLTTLLKKFKTNSIPIMLEKLENWREKEISRLEELGEKTDPVEEKYDCIMALVEASNAKTVDDIINHIGKIFSDNDSTIVFSTIHRAKGLEADNVFYLYPNIVCKTKKDWEEIQEKNIKYIALTRAKKIMYMVYQER